MTFVHLILWAWVLLPIAILIAWAFIPIRTPHDPMAEVHGPLPILRPPPKIFEEDT